MRAALALLGVATFLWTSCAPPRLACDGQVDCPSGEFCGADGFCDEGDLPVTPDAGPPVLDAGEEPKIVDAGPPLEDAGPPVDAGGEPPDAGVPLDAGAPLDAGVVDAGFDAGPPELNRLVALDPARGQVGDTLILHGRFLEDLVVTFPGAAPLDVSVPAPDEMVAITVPADAETGALEVSTASGRAVRSVPFRLLTYREDIGPFNQYYEQSPSGRELPRVPNNIAVGIQVATTAKWLYVFASTADETIRRARIYADGTIGELNDAGIDMLQVRQRSGIAQTDTHVYLFGGNTPEGVDFVDIYPIVDDALAAPFAGPPLTQARSRPQAAVIGSSVVVVGGFVEGPGVMSDRVETARIRPDGSLEDFVIGPPLIEPRVASALFVSPTRLSVITGITTDFGAPTNDTEEVQLGPEGLVGDWAPGLVILPELRNRGAPMRLSNQLCLIGGNTVTDPQSATMDCAPITGGELGTFARSPRELRRQRDSLMSVVLPERVLILSGTNDVGTLIVNESARLDNGADFDTFVRLPQDMQRTRLDHSCAIVGDAVFVLGGTGDELEVERASIGPGGELGDFVVQPQLPRNFSRGSVSVARNRIQAIGGGGGNSDVMEAAINEDTSTIGGFTQRANAMSIERPNAVLFRVGANVFMAGGFATAGPTNLVERSVNGQDPWAVQFESLVESRAAAVATVVADQGFIIGGIGVGDAFSSTTEVSDFVIGDPIGWGAGPDVSVQRRDANLVVVGDEVHVLGGRDATQANLRSREIFAFDEATGLFSSAGVDVNFMPAEQGSRLCAFRVGNFVYLLGGRSETGVSRAVSRAVVFTP